MTLPSKNLDKIPWSKTHTYAFIAFSAGFFLEAYIFGLASIVTGWVTVPKILESTLLAWAPLWLIIGIITFGPLSDRLGRKRMFLLSMSLYGIGALGLIFSYTYFLLLPFLAMMLFAAGGEMNTIMALTHEIMPSVHRSKAFFLELNFVNIGGFVLGLVGFLVQNQSVQFQRLMIGITILIVLIILIYARLKIPKSIRLLLKQGKVKEAEEQMNKYFGNIKVISQDELQQKVKVKKLSTWFKLMVGIFAAGANTIGYGLMTYVLGPYFFPSQTPLIILVTNLVEMLTGLIIGVFADKLSRKLLLLISFIGAVGFTFLIATTIPFWSRSLVIFYFLLALLNIFVGISYLTEDALKSEIWPTQRRGTFTAIVRFVSIGAYIPIIYLTSSFNIYQYTFFNGIVWTLGLIASIAWFVKGYETGKGISIEEIEG